jgi:DNA-binding response OmpR family regulator
MALPSAKLLVIEDDYAIRQLIVRFLKQKNYQVQDAADGETALSIFDQFQPDLVILDVNLPDVLGYNLCEQIQARRDVYVLMLTARADVEDKRRGFLKGADDYLTKPFNLEELELRVGAILKRRRLENPVTPHPLAFDNLTIDPVRREVVLAQSPVLLTALEFDLLYCLASEPGKVWTRSDLINQVWDYDYLGDHRVVDVHIGQIRKKIESDCTHPTFIQTVRGIGYKFSTLESSL